MPSDRRRRQTPLPAPLPDLFPPGPPLGVTRPLPPPLGVTRPLGGRFEPPPEPPPPGFLGVAGLAGPELLAEPALLADAEPPLAAPRRRLWPRRRRLALGRAATALGRPPPPPLFGAVPPPLPPPPLAFGPPPRAGVLPDPFPPAFPVGSTDVVVVVASASPGIGTVAEGHRLLADLPEVRHDEVQDHAGGHRQRDEPEEGGHDLGDHLHLRIDGVLRHARPSSASAGSTRWPPLPPPGTDPSTDWRLVGQVDAERLQLAPGFNSA